MSKKHRGSRKSEIQIGRAKNAFYWSLRVEAVQMMEHCSLIRYRKRKFIVDTADLVQRESGDLMRLQPRRAA
jgi:hypothetical protein